VAKTRILQGGHLDMTGLSKGKHLFQCCIHPWMRMEVEVSSGSHCELTACRSRRTKMIRRGYSGHY
jgi:hypothetical protein